MQLIRKFVAVLIISIFICYVSELNAQTFRFPLDGGWSVTLDFGDYNPGWGTHLAEDVSRVGGTPVYASADGTVKFAGSSTGYKKAIVIEHYTGNEYVCTLYGHLSTSLGLKVGVNQNVTKGQLIGYIAYDNEDGGSWGPHLHFGVRKGKHPGNWVYYGYEPPGDINDWYDPSDFISSHLGYDDEIIVKGSAPEIFFLKNNILHHITDWSIYERLRDYGYGPYQTWNDVDLEKFFKGSKIISDGLICQQQNDINIYLIQYNKKRSFTNETIYTNRGYKLSGGDPISPTVIWLPDGMLDDIPTDPSNITDFGINVNGELYFEKNGQITTNFSIGDTKDSYFKLTAGDGYTVYNYLRITWPDGTQKYAYYPDGDVNGNFLFSTEKIPMKIENGIGKTFNIVPKYWNEPWKFNTYTFTSSTTPGTYTWEFWYEDINRPGVILFKDTKSYQVTEKYPSGNIPLTANPSSVPNNGGTSTITSGTIKYNDGSTVDDGTLIEVATTLGTVSSVIWYSREQVLMLRLTVQPIAGGMVRMEKVIMIMDRRIVER